MSQFTASLDGNPEASNPYIKHYVPYCINSQLLIEVAIYSAACFLTDSGHVERTVAMAHKGRVIKLLNEHIRSQLSTSDEVIAGVVQLILDEWCVLPTHISTTSPASAHPSLYPVYIHQQKTKGKGQTRADIDDCRLWGNTNDLWAHLRGLREMIRSRGGFRMLGLHGLISKLAIS